LFKLSFLSVWLLYFLTACSTQVVLKSNLPPELVAAFQPDHTTQATVVVTSRLPTIYKHKNESGYFFNFPLNVAAMKKINDYVREKFPAGPKATKSLALTVEIVSAKVGYGFDQSTGEAVLTLKVSAAGSQTIAPITVTGSGSANSQFYNNLAGAYATAMDMAIDRAIVSIDKTLSSRSTVAAE